MPAALDVVVEAPATRASYIQWPGVWAGAMVAGAVSFVLLTFGSAIGLTVAPLAPTWRTASLTFSLLSGLWVLAIAIGSAAAGGYIAGRTRTTWHVTHTDQVEFRDGVHGLVVWALGLTISALVGSISAAALALSPIGAAAASQAASGGAMAYEVDRLFRGGEAAVVPTPAAREEANRALMAASAGAAFSSDDRAALVRLVGETVRTPPDVAQARVDQSIALVRQKLRATRHAGVILAFITAAAAAAAAVAAWQAASLGGRHRDASA